MRRKTFCSPVRLSLKAHELKETVTRGDLELLNCSISAPPLRGRWAGGTPCRRWRRCGQHVIYQGENPRGIWICQLCTFVTDGCVHLLYNSSWKCHPLAAGQLQSGQTIRYARQAVRPVHYSTNHTRRVTLP